jgi:predicted GIY-YIG superfamily endonuclease
MQETVHDDFFKNFTVVTATQSAVDYLPDRSGIYAIYHAFDFMDNNLVGDIDERIQSTVFKSKFYEEANRTKFIVDMCAEPARLSASMGNFIEAVSLPKDRRILKQSLLYCSILQRPDYIGTSTNLKNRFTQHLEKDDGFFSKYVESLPSDQFLFVCFPCSQNHARELESLLIQLCQPKFNTQRS